jgi:hypothetical protein
MLEGKVPSMLRWISIIGGLLIMMMLAEERAFC